MTKRKTLTPKQKTEIMDAHDGKCWRCGEGFSEGEKIEFDHKHALARGGADTPDNIGPAHVHCHALKTYGGATKLGADIFEIAKTKRLAKKHRGKKKTVKRPWPARRPGMPKFRRKLDGTVEPYDRPARMS